MRRSYRPDSFGRQLIAIQTAPSRVAKLRRVSAPTLVLHGSHDPLVPLAGGKDTAANIPGARLRIVPGMGHFLPEALVPLLVDEIAGHCLNAEDAAQSQGRARRRGVAMKRLSVARRALPLHGDARDADACRERDDLQAGRAAGGSLRALSRAHRGPARSLASYRRRLEPTPLGIDHPAWVVEDKVDLDYHIRHEALPKPGGMQELRALIAQLHAVPLDRSRPLWEYHFIEGLEDGGFAVYVKVHHTTMDGIAGMATLGVTFDFEPDAEHEGLPQRSFHRDVEPTDFIEMTSTAIGDFVRQGWRAVKSLPGRRQGADQGRAEFRRDARFLYGYVKDMPRTPFNRAISGHRVYATSSLPLAEVRALAKSRGVTINDVVLALCAGALRRYLVEHAALPEKPLTVGVPVSMRPPGNAQLNNQVVFTLSRLPTDVAEPLPRLAAAKAAGQEAKNLFADMRDLVTTDISILGAPLFVMGLTRLWAGARGGQLPLAVLQCRHLERARTEADHVLRRRAGHALFPGLDSLPRLRAQHHGAELSRPARFRPGRLQRDRARRSTHRRLHR